MANTTVTKVSELLLTNVTPGVKAGDAKVSDAQGFSEVMNNVKDSPTKVQPQDDTKTTRTVVETPKSKEIKAEEPVKRDPIANESDKADFTEEVAEDIKKIVDTIKEVLEVSDEELTEAMETLGLTVVDLLDPTSIRDVCMELKGVTDSISLITNADLYESVKEIVQIAEDAVTDLTAQFGITDVDTEKIFTDDSFIDAVEKTLSDQNNNSVAPELQISEAVIPTDGMITQQMPIQDKDVAEDAVNAPQLNTDNNQTAGTEAQAVTVEVNGTPEAKPERPVTEANRPEAEEVRIDDPLARTNVETTETFKATVKTEESNLNENSNSEHASRFVDAEAISAAPQTTVVNTEVNNLGEIVETVTTYSNADADSIMSQVTQSIRVNYSAETTSMEMQLHPASLGTVNMNVASNSGVVTAHILVENEAVKAALESQLITLQQTFEDQGMKVEAVEVTVANYDLNKGNSSDTENGNSERESARAGRVGTRRRINLNDLEEADIEELDEDEQIAADMMARSGNSVDYQA